MSNLRTHGIFSPLGIGAPSAVTPTPQPDHEAAKEYAGIVWLFDGPVEVQGANIYNLARAYLALSLRVEEAEANADGWKAAAEAWRGTAREIQVRINTALSEASQNE